MANLYNLNIRKGEGKEMTEKKAVTQTKIKKNLQHERKIKTKAKRGKCAMKEIDGDIQSEKKGITARRGESERDRKRQREIGQYSASNVRVS